MGTCFDMAAPRQIGDTLLTRARRFFLPLLVLMGLSLCFPIVGLATPGWVIYAAKYGSFEFYEGLWSIRTCVSGNCTSKSIGEDDKNSIFYGEPTEYRVETCLALASIFLAIVAGALSRRPDWLQRTAFSVIILSVISGILALIASGTVTHDTRTIHDLAKDGGYVRFPYSVLLTGIGGILACITSIVGVCCVRPFTNESENTPAYQLTSGPPQYQTQTVCQTHIAQHYTGQPYLAQSNQNSVYPANAYPANPLPVNTSPTNAYPANAHPANFAYSANAYPTQPSAPNSGHIEQNAPGENPDFQNRL